jgi:hypothetical protein
MGRPGSDSHETLDAQTFASWGVDYLKVKQPATACLTRCFCSIFVRAEQEDSCGGTTHGSIWDQYARMRDALNKTGRPIYYSITGIVPYNDAWPSMHVSAAAPFASCFTVLKSPLCTVHR